MMLLASTLLPLLGLAASSTAQFVSPPKHLHHTTGHANIPVRYKQVPPGICEQDPSVKSFSGYADVSPHEHIFFWFFEARDVDPHHAPLTIWINGGPGSSSMIGLFQELGPCGVDYHGKPYDNPYSWSRRSNVVFIDQPAQVGFSYSIPVEAYQDEYGEVKVLHNKTCPPESVTGGTCGTWSFPSEEMTANSTVNAAPNMWKTLQGFMGAFPQYARHGVHFASESYGGHYAPVFSKYFEEQNAKDIPDAKEIRLESVMIGNGWYDPVINYAAYYNFTVSPGNTYDYSPFNKTIQEKMYDNVYGKGNCVDQLKECAKHGDNKQCGKADNYCASNVEGLLDDIPNRDEYDIRELMPDPFPYAFYVDYLNTAHVQEAIGAYTNFSESSATVGDAFGTTADDGREVGSIEALRSLVTEYNLTVALYAGDADYNCNWMGGEVIADMVEAPGWEHAGYVNISSSDGKVNGQVKQSGRFSFSRVYESGHEVPFYQPVLALEMMERAIEGRDIATGKIKVCDESYKTKGTKKSEYREGNATVQWDVVPKKLTYDTKTHMPGKPWKGSGKKKDSEKKKRAFKPRWRV